MDQQIIYVLSLIAAAVISATVALLAWRRRPAAGAIPLFWTMGAVAWWSLAYALELASADLIAKVFWAKVQYLGIVTVPITFLILVLQFTHRDRWLARRNSILLVLVPVLTVLLVWTNDSHGLIWSDIRLDAVDSFSVLNLNYGAFFWVWIAFSYPLILLSSGLLIQALLRSPSPRRRQALALLIAALAPLVANVLRISGLNPLPQLDLTNFAFTLSGVALFWAIFHFRLLDMVPVARDTVIESMDDGVIVLDDQNRIVDLNPAAERIIGRPISQAIGQSAAQVLPHWHDVGERHGDAAESRTEIIMGEGASQRHFDLRISPLLDERNLFAGRIVVVRDITKRKRAEESVRESQERFRSLFNEVPACCWTFDREARILDWNQACEDLYGWTSEQVIGKSMYDLMVKDENIVPTRETIAEVFQGRSFRGLEYEDWRADGTVCHVLTNEYPVFNARGEVEFGICAELDISERRRSEEALRESEERYRLLFGNAPLGIVSADTEGNILAVNPAALNMLGSPSAEATREINLLTFPLLKKAGIAADFGRVLETGTSIVSERCYTSKWGKETWFRYYLTPIQDTDHRTIGLQVILEDVTERKRAEDELRYRAAQQESLNAIIAAAVTAADLPELLDTILNHLLSALGLEMGGIWVPPYVCIHGLPSELQSAMNQAAAAAELEISEPVVVGDWQQVPADDPLSALSPVMDRFGIRASLFARVLVEGKSLGGLSLAAPAPRSWSAGEIALTEAVGRQLGAAAERLRLLEETYKQAQQVQQIMTTVPEGVLLLAPDGQVVQVNPAGEEYLVALAGARVGDTPTHLGGRPLAELLTSPPEGLWHEVRTAGPPARAFEVVARPVEPGPDNQGWVLVMRDVTRELEVQLHTRQQERLAAVGQLAAGIAHDFNNIMAVITLYSQMAQRAPDLSPETRGRLETVDEQAKRASNLIQQILDFGRQTVMERRPLDMVPLLEEQVELLKRTLPESIGIELTYGADEYTAEADPTRVQQVILNLAVNARDAMPEGGRLRIGLERIWVADRKSAPLRELGSGEWLQVTVSDDGIGVPEDQLTHIFEPFFTTKEVGKGSGLGLAQVYGIVRQHDGFIDVTSKVGEGSTFTIYLPAMSAAKVSEDGAKETPSSAAGRSQTILVVEDDAAVREALVGGLEMLDYRTLGATDGREALALFEQHADEIALVVTDLVMPRMGGKALARALRQLAPAVKIVVLTGHPLDDGGKSLEAAGVAAWLYKPPDLGQLAQVLERVLQET